MVFLILSTECLSTSRVGPWSIEKSLIVAFRDQGSRLHINSNSAFSLRRSYNLLLQRERDLCDFSPASKTSSTSAVGQSPMAASALDASSVATTFIEEEPTVEAAAASMALSFHFRSRCSFSCFVLVFAFSCSSFWVLAPVSFLPLARCFQRLRRLTAKECKRPIPCDFHDDEDAVGADLEPFLAMVGADMMMMEGIEISKLYVVGCGCWAAHNVWAYGRLVQIVRRFLRSFFRSTIGRGASFPATYLRGMPTRHQASATTRMSSIEFQQAASDLSTKGTKACFHYAVRLLQDAFDKMSFDLPHRSCFADSILSMFHFANR